METLNYCFRWHRKWMQIAKKVDTDEKRKRAINHAKILGNRVVQISNEIGTFKKSNRLKSLIQWIKSYFTKAKK